ncbi:hypothetical protein AURDEDRAFT_128999 [Auricularia subglabra TFB-10046 SS5]|nr:hypothetical protein AURDEDRAFT_128999 [Auricularia subglabra TFB-10046 SS5]
MQRAGGLWIALNVCSPLAFMPYESADRVAQEGLEKPEMFRVHTIHGRELMRLERDRHAKSGKLKQQCEARSALGSLALLPGDSTSAQERTDNSLGTPRRNDTCSPQQLKLASGRRRDAPQLPPEELELAFREHLLRSQTLVQLVLGDSAHASPRYATSRTALKRAASTELAYDVAGADQALKPRASTSAKETALGTTPEPQGAEVARAPQTYVLRIGREKIKRAVAGGASAVPDTADGDTALKPECNIRRPMVQCDHE